MRRLLPASLAVTVLLVVAGDAIAQEDGVVVDPDSPAGKEYAIPFDEARREAGGGGSRGAPGSAAPFGEGVVPEGHEAGDTGSADGQDRDGGDGGGTGSGARDGNGRGSSPGGAPGVAASVDSGGPSAGLLTGGIALGVLLVGGLVGLLVRRTSP